MKEAGLDRHSKEEEDPITLRHSFAEKYDPVTGEEHHNRDEPVTHDDHHVGVLSEETRDALKPPLSQRRATWPTLLWSAMAALNSVNLGYDLGVSTNAGPLLMKDQDLSQCQLELFLGSLNFWSIWGALLSPIVTESYGRRNTFFVAALLFVVGVLAQSTAKSYAFLMLGRMVVGLAVGVGEAVDPMYIAEIAPPHLRGELVSWAEAGVSFGVVLGFASSFCFNMEDPTNWRNMIAIGAAMPIVMILLVKLRLMPESPRFLVQKGRSGEAREVLERIYPEPGVSERVIKEIEEALQLEEAASKAVGWEALLCQPSPATRRMLIVGCGLATIQQAVGIDSIMFYMMFVIQASGIRSDTGQAVALITLGTVKLIFVFVGAKLLDKWGRRPMLFMSLLGLAASLVVVSATIDGDSPLAKMVLIGSLATYLAFFSSGLGPGNWVVISEVFALSIRAKAMSIAILPNRITATIMASSFLSVAKALTWPGFFMLLCGICLGSCLFLYVYLPETAGKSLEEMAAYFAEITGDRSILDVEEKLHGGGGDLELNKIDQREVSTEMSSDQKGFNVANGALS
eukprot:CAMPEP_0168727240 /NCGR_PEP_ID=MMETSP0724-20121128/5077_1 /TAXON_ID=265536 /ORGANISM="Amphiprora sp., Strain CCMP467" /LENGTH=570 /DNA_ID=CAMNT_0008774069 /DNA_START=65 /DNA_END=1777 /DNA_ORIENTATION=+